MSVSPVLGQVCWIEGLVSTQWAPAGETVRVVNNPDIALLVVNGYAAYVEPPDVELSDLPLAMLAAQAARDDAEAAALVATTAIGAIGSSVDDAETAQAGAVAAQNAAEDARDLAEQYRDEAAGYVGGVADGAVTTSKLGDGAVTAAKTSAGVQTSLGKADSAVQPADLAGYLPDTAGSVDATNLAAGSVVAGKLAANAVNTTAIGDGAVTAAKLDTAAKPFDIAYPHSRYARAIGLGDLPLGVRLERAVTFTRVVYRVQTGDGAGGTTAEIRRNGSPVSGTPATVTGTTSQTRTGSWAFSEGDILSVQITGVGTNPGTGLMVSMKGTWT